MKELSLKQMETTVGGKFWGHEVVYGPCIKIGNSEGFRTVTTSYKVFWLEVAGSWDTISLRY